MNRLKELRQKKGMTQREFSRVVFTMYHKEEAILFNIPYRTLQRWESGETPIKPDKAQALADYFGVSVGFLLGYESPKGIEYLAWECKISKLRKEKGITKETLSKETNIPLDLISEWENDNGSYTKEQLELLSGYLKVPISEIIGYSIDFAKSELINLIDSLSDKSKQKLFNYAKDLKALEDFNKANNT